MVVIRPGIVAIVLLVLTPTVARGQGGELHAYVPNKQVVQDRPFWLIVEASGASVEMPEVEQGDGVVINASSPQQSTQFTIGGGQQQQTVRLSFSSVAIRPGKVTIPPVKARINGRLMETDPIVLDVRPAPNDESESRAVRAWVSTKDVTVGKPFWIFVEATGMEIELPDTLDVDGLMIDPRNSQRSTSFSFGRQGQRTTEKRGFYAVPTREGKIVIPPIEVRVTGRIVKTDPIEVTAERAAIPPSGSSGDQAAPGDLTADDLVFIRMDTDKQTAYQGECISLSMQLWRIKHPRISSGPYRGALITSPTTEGFFVRELDPTQYDATTGSWTYNVAETRKLLYPTRPGTLTVGQWHWEGIALLNRQSLVMRDKLYYKLDAGPIDIKVKPLPAAPPGFTGGVGQFDVSAALSQQVVKQGVPTALTVKVNGFGNPDAIGDPRLPGLEWANVRDAQRDTEFFDDDDGVQPKVEKTFTFSITPSQAGHKEIPAFSFAYFDPDEGKYQTTTLGPYDVDVLESAEGTSNLVASPDVPVAERQVDILAEDIRPLVERAPNLQASRRGTSLLAVVAVLIVPVVLYIALVAFLAYRRKLQSESGWARSQQARAKGLRRLTGVESAGEPIEALYRAMTAYVADLLNLQDAGLTSADVKRELDYADVPDALSGRTIQILKACERARYGSQRLNRNEVHALLSAAEACMNELDAVVKRGRSA